MTQGEIQQLIQGFFEKASYAIEGIEVVLDNDIDTIRFSLSINEPKQLIGRNGEVLRSINSLIRRMVEQKIGDESKVPSFMIDINNYSARQIDDLKTRAKIVADRARSFKHEIALDPMSPYERLIIHSYLASQNDIDTESRGEGRERHVVVKYKD